MPPLAPRQMTKAQKKAVEEVVAGPRGALIGPFIPAMRSPEFMNRLQALGEYLRYGSALGPKLGEMVILLTARLWTQNFEWFVHAPLARKYGLKKKIVDAIAEGRRPRGMAGDEAVVYDFFMELQANRSVSDGTYNAAVKAFGEAGVMDLTGAVGYYSTLAMIMNVARTPVPGDPQPGLLPFPQ
jgi:4-carboxymuconolactone decarboxylase